MHGIRPEVGGWGGAEIGRVGRLLRFAEKPIYAIIQNIFFPRYLVVQYYIRNYFCYVTENESEVEILVLNLYVAVIYLFLDLNILPSDFSRCCL